MDLFANHILTVVLFTPLVGAIVMLFIPREAETAHKIAANIFGVLGFLVSIPLIRWWNPGASRFSFEENLSWIPSIGARYHLGIDGISLLLVMLTTLITAVSILCSWSAIQDRLKEYYAMMLLLGTAMIGVFVSLDFSCFTCSGKSC